MKVELGERMGKESWVRKLKSVHIPPGREGSVKMTNCDQFHIHNSLSNVNKNDGIRCSWSSTSGKPPPL